MAIVPEKTTITNLQLRKALREMEKYDDVVALVTGSGDTNITDAWEYANVFIYDDPLMQSVCNALSVDIDELFNLASTK